MLIRRCFIVLFPQDAPTYQDEDCAGYKTDYPWAESALREAEFGRIFRVYENSDGGSGGVGGFGELVHVALRAGIPEAGVGMLFVADGCLETNAEIVFA